MKKKLLTLAVAAALPMAAQAANAEVTIYGQVHLSVDYLNYDSDQMDDQWDVTSRASRIGFKGSEDLGDGLKMIWKIESQVNMADGNGAYWKGRNAYIGLAGGWGTFLYGRHDTPMKMSTGKLDIFADTIADYNLGGNGLIDIRANDAIAYVSPSFGGLTLVGAIVPDGDYDGDGDFAGGYSLAAMYSNGGLFLSGAYESLDDLLGGADASHWRIGAGFDMGAFHIGGVFADQDDFQGGNVYTINGSWTFGNNVLKAMWERSEVDMGTIDEDYDSWAIGLDHNFSKRSKAYIIYADSDVNLQDTNGAGEQDGFSMGLVHKF
jgi:predicted porin